MIFKTLETIGNQKITPTQWALSFLGILFVRFIFEAISSPASTGIIPSDPYTLVHYTLFFLSVSLIAILLIGYATKNYKEASNITLFGLPLLWIAPIADIILSRGQGYKMLYIFDTGNQILINFLTFFGPQLNAGATYGMRIGIACSLLGIAWYIWLKTKNMIRSITITFILYIAVFIIGSLPGIIYTTTHFKSHNTTNQQVVKYFENIILQSNISHNTLHDGKSSVTPERFIELGFNKLLSQILFTLSCIFTLLLFWKMEPHKFTSVLKNARPERINFYTASLFCGIGFAYINELATSFIWVDILGIMSLTISWIALWMHAVHINDIADIEIDRISNTSRPLIRQELNFEDMGEVGNIWLAIALMGAWSAGYYPFFMALVYVACSYIYSTPPLRLRRFPLAPSFLIGVACLATILAGFFFVSNYKEIQNFPTRLAIGVVVMVTLAINFKDIKDIEGDRANGILTLPIILGENGIRITAILFALSILLIPIFLSFYFLYIFALPAAIAGYKILIKKPYKEKPVFTLRFILLTLIALSYIAIYFLAQTHIITV